jgi:hypothetical protein
MSSTNLVARAVVLAGITAALSLPSTARAQTPERALLNQWPAVSATAFARFQAPATRFQAPATAQHAVIDGERALLNRSQTVILTVESATPVIADAPVDGVKALLNRSSS